MPTSPPADPAVLIVAETTDALRAHVAALAPLRAELGARLLTACGADEALRHAGDDDATAVIVLDVTAPGADGVAVARRIRERRATEHVPILFVAPVDAERRRATTGWVSGAVGYLASPVDPDALREHVRAFVDLHRRRTDATLAERRRFADRIARIEAAAHASDARLRAVLESLPDAVGVFDAEWRWSFANPAMRELLRRQGYDPDGVLGRVVWEHMPDLCDTPFGAALRRARETGRLEEFEERVAVLDAWYEQRVVPGPDGTVTVYSRDVSLRHHAAAELRASEARLRPVMASGIVGVLFWHVDGAVTEANDAFLEPLGYTRDDVAAGRLDWRRLTPPEFAASDAVRVEELLATGAHGPYEKAYFARDGRIVPVLIASAFLSDARDRGVSVCLDLTERRRAEEERARALRDEAAVVDTVQRIGAALAAELDIDRLVQAVTDAATTLVGARFGALYYDDPASRPAAGLVLRAVSGDARAVPVLDRRFTAVDVVRRDDLTTEPGLASAVPPDDAAIGAPVRSYLAVAVRSRAGDVLGRLVFGHERAGAFGERDERLVIGIAGAAAVALDNARLYAAERQAAVSARLLQQVTAAFSAALTPDAVIDVLLEHGVPALGARTGLVMLRSADGRSLERAGDRGYGDGFMARYARLGIDERYPVTAAVRARRGVWLETQAEARAQHPDAHAVYEAGGYQATAAVPLVDGGGEVFGSLVFHFAEPRRFGAEERSVIEALARQLAQALERARLFERERAARAEAEQANRAKSDFLAVMSHELRTPLNAIAGYAELLALGIRGPVTAEQLEDLRRLQQSQRHLLGLINEVLNFTRIETGAVRYERADVVLAEVVASVEPLVAPQLAARGLAYDASGCTGSGLCAHADREKVRQVLLNLLSNAIKFTERGGRVTVSITEVGGADGRVAVHVCDTGVGIAPDQLGHVFEPFVQVNARLTRTNEGVGLGLAISRDLARGMGGDLTVDSAPGVGSTFTLLLPRACARGT